MPASKDIPVTVITGQLGAGKTTLILNAVKQVSPDYKLMWLKNEYGDINIDAELAKLNSIQTQEIINGCLCCVLVGKLHDALQEIVAGEYELDRLVIETAGTAYPYPIVQQIEETKGLRLDGLVKVIDAENFVRFGDKSHLARSQAKFIDLIVLNKIDDVDQTVFENVLDEVHDLFTETPKFKAAKGIVPIGLLWGWDHKSLPTLASDELHQHKEQIDAFGFDNLTQTFSRKRLDLFLHSLDASRFYRVKGILMTDEGLMLLNYVFGKLNWEPIENKIYEEGKITFMGKGLDYLEEKTGKEFFNCEIS